jgi:hypothetical protein
MSEDQQQAVLEMSEDQQEKNLLHLQNDLIVQIITHLPSLSDSASLQLVSRDLRDHCEVGKVFEAWYQGCLLGSEYELNKCITRSHGTLY